jgi:outer membrane protein TolC
MSVSLVTAVAYAQRDGSGVGFGSPLVTGSPCSDDVAPKAVDLTEAVVDSLSHEPGLIVARQDVMEARSDITASLAPFMPSIQFALVEERFVPSNSLSPVVVVGNTVLGGAQTKSAYGALVLNWNIMNSGRDIAAYHGAQANMRAASSALDNQLGDTLSTVLQAAADVYEAEVTARSDADVLVDLNSMLSRADERFRAGHGTTLAIGQARASALEGQQTLSHSCQILAEKSAVLAQAIGIRVSVQERLLVEAPLPLPIPAAASEMDADTSIDVSPAVVAAREKLTVAQTKLREAQRAFGPTMSLSVRRDYLGQSPNSFATANSHVAPSDYRVGLTIEQPLFPFDSEVAGVGKARAQLRKAQAEYDRAWLEAQTHFRSVRSSRLAAVASYAAAKASLAESERLLELTESLYRGGRTDLDNVAHAQVDLYKARAAAQTLASRRALAEWMAERALRPVTFPEVLFEQLHVHVDTTDSRSDAESITP